jgi:hypothetical protein
MTTITCALCGVPCSGLLPLRVAIEGDSPGYASACAACRVRLLPLTIEERRHSIIFYREWRENPSVRIGLSLTEDRNRKAESP